MRYLFSAPVDSPCKRSHAAFLWSQWITKECCPVVLLVICILWLALVDCSSVWCLQVNCLRGSSTKQLSGLPRRYLAVVADIYATFLSVFSILSAVVNIFANSAFCPYAGLLSGVVYKYLCCLCFCRHCWFGIRKSIRLVKLSDEVLVWLCVWSELHIVCIWSSWCHCHPKTPISCLI